MALTFLCLTFISFNSFSQNKENILEDSYSSYFNVNVKTIYLHFNKQTFLLNESIWFKGYVYDKEAFRLLQLDIYVTLYDKDGKAVKTSLYYAGSEHFQDILKSQKI